MKSKKKLKSSENLINHMIKDLYKYLKSKEIDTFKPIINVNRDYLYLADKKGNKIFYNEETDDFKVKCRIKCIKDDNTITFLDEPIFMDLFAKTNRDVLSIINSRM